MKKVGKAVFCVVAILLLGIFSQQEIKAGEAGERHYSKAYSVLSANVGNASAISEQRLKLRSNSDEEAKVRFWIDKLKPDIVILVETYNQEQVDSVTGHLYYSVHGGPYDFICVKKDIGDVIKHVSMPEDGSYEKYKGNSVGYVDVGLKDEGGRKVRLFYAHFPSYQGVWTPEKHKVHRDAFEWISRNLNIPIPCLIAGDLNNDFTRGKSQIDIEATLITNPLLAKKYKKEQVKIHSSLYIEKQVKDLNLWIFNPLAQPLQLQLLDGSAERDYEATWRLPEEAWKLTIDWVMGKFCVPPFLAPEGPKTDLATGTTGTIRTNFLTSPPDWWKDTGSLTFDHKPFYGKVVFFWEDRKQPPPTAEMRVLFLKEAGDGKVLDLFAVGPDGSGVKKVLPAVISRDIGGYGPNRVAISPDGKKIAAAVARDAETNEIRSWGDLQIEIINLERPTEKKIVPLKEYGMRYWALGGLRWSPDGTKIAFIYHEDIYVINVNGTGLICLFDNDENYEPFPNWWPDGKKIIFLKKTGKAAWEWQLFVVYLDDHKKIESANLLPETCGRPEWSPDGKKIAFTGQDGELWVGNFLNGKVVDAKPITARADRQAILGTYAVWEKYWSKDSSKIVFSDSRQEVLAVIDCDGSNLKTIQSGTAGLVGWSGISPPEPKDWQPDILGKWMTKDGRITLEFKKDNTYLMMGPLGKWEIVQTGYSSYTLLIGRDRKRSIVEEDEYEIIKPLLEPLGIEDLAGFRGAVVGELKGEAIILHWKEENELVKEKGAEVVKSSQARLWNRYAYTQPGQKAGGLLEFKEDNTAWWGLFGKWEIKDNAIKLQSVGELEEDSENLPNFLEGKIKGGAITIESPRFGKDLVFRKQD